jgi:hypothetical protein
MTKVVGIYDVDTGERGWLQYEPKPFPIKYLMWIKSRGTDARIRAYLREPFEMAVQKRKPKHDPPWLDKGVEWIMVNPTDNLGTFETALLQMKGAIRIGLERLGEE